MQLRASRRSAFASSCERWASATSERPTRSCPGRSTRRRPRSSPRSCAVCSTPTAASTTATKSRYVGLGSASKQLLQGAQRLLSTFGVASSIYADPHRHAERVLPTQRSTVDERSYNAGPMFDLRICSPSIAAFADEIGFTVTAKVRQAREAARRASLLQRRPDDDSTRRTRSDDGVELTYNLSEPRNHSYVANGVVVRNC